MIEQRRVRVGLGRGREVGRKRRSKVAEARWGDDPVSFAEVAADEEPLIVSTAGAVDQQERLAVAMLGILDEARGGRCHRAARFDGRFDTAHVAAEARVSGEAGAEAEQRADS